MALSKEDAKEEIRKLVKDFNSYTSDELDKKSENQIKSEFIDSLFEFLGWNMKKDAEREERILKGRADYILRIGNQQFLVIEAKKTSVKLTEEEGRQAVSYAYHNKIKFAVLTNFRQIRIYHALSNIKNIDKNLLKDEKGYLWINCDAFESQFDRLWLISKESFEKGEINKLLSSKDERLHKPINDSLLDDLLNIRGWLSKELKAKKNSLGSEIDEIVQILIDRLIFMRSVEDRGLEPKDFLLKLDDDVRTQRVKYQLFPYLLEKFKDFNKKYDSKLFEEGLLEKEGAFSDDVLHKAIRGLYFGTESAERERYMFDQIPGDLLGSIYEQYLGTVLKESEKRIKLVSGGGKRKSMGIFYTPSYIVDYIVRNTVGEYLKNKNIDEIMQTKILDPACGSGSFIVRAFQEVCSIVEEKLKKGEHSSKWVAFKSYDSRLNLGQKIAVLVNCIYGVDLDEKAVELARLNLLLKLLEDEGQETKKLLLPHLENNIKCGNSLIDDNTISERAFNWKAQFPDVFKQDGFDVVIGNPPYINAIELSKTVGEKVKEFWKRKYYAAKGTYDIYILFFELSFNVCKDSGFISFITPNKYLSSPYGIALRELIVKNYKITKILDLSKVKVFNDPSVYPMITIMQKTKPAGTYTLITEKIFSENLDDKIVYKINSKNLTLFPEFLWGIILSDNLEIIEKIFKESKMLSEVSEVQATSTAAEADEYSKYINENEKGLPIINTGTIDRYATTYGKTKFMNKGKQLMRPFLNITQINDKRKALYQSPKIIISKLALRIEGFLDKNGSYASINTNCIHTPQGVSVEYLAGLINSNLISFTYSELFSGLKMSGGYFQFQAPQLRVLPTKLPTEDQEKKMVALVNQMLELQKKANADKIIGHEKEHLEQQIKNVDYEIDELVYNIYGITDEEKKIIEESLR